MSIPPEIVASEIDSAALWNVLESLSDGCFTWHPDNDAVQWSARFYKTLGYTADSAATLSDVAALIHPEDREWHDAMLAEHRETRTDYRCKLRLLNAAGAYQVLDVRGHWHVPDDTGDLILMGFVTDITESEAMRAELVRSHTMLRDFLDRAPAGAYIKDAGQCYVYANAQAAHLAGQEPRAFIGKSPAEIYDAETAASLDAANQRVLHAGETVIWEGPIQSPDGGTRHVIDTKFPISDPETGAIQIGGFRVDVTRERQAARALAHSRKMEALGQLVAGIAHDFNNTLAVLQGNIELMEIIDDPVETRAGIAELKGAVGRGRRLTEQLVAFGRKTHLNAEIIDLNASITGSFDEVLSRTLPDAVSVRTVLGTDLPLVEIDRTHVQNALINLMINARDAMPDGGSIVIATDLVPGGKHPAEIKSAGLDPDASYVCLTVRDSGHGMPQQDVERAFEPFFTTKPAHIGSGMGLAVVYGIVSQHGGSARITSTPGHGTSVHLYFPVHEEGGNPSRKAFATLSRGAGHILLVEDEPAVRKVVNRQLSAMGYRVTAAASGAQAISLLEKDRFDLVLTDVVMPGDIQGPGVAKKVRDTMPGTPVVFMSGYPLANTEHMSTGTAYVTKPVSIQELSNALDSALQKA